MAVYSASCLLGWNYCDSDVELGGILGFTMKRRWKTIKVPTEPVLPVGQKSFFEVETADQLANDGMEASYRHSTTEYKEAARERLHWLVSNYSEFTSDDIVNHLNRIGVVGNHSALGAIIRSAERVGLIVFSGRFAESNRPELHKRSVRVWRSLVDAGGKHE
jgi:hypothetical protein